MTNAGEAPGAVHALIDLVRSGERSGAELLVLARRAAREAARDEACTRELFTGLIEPLSDSFEPAACDTYAALFSGMIAELMPEFGRDELMARYQQVRRRPPGSRVPAGVKRVYVLSRVTLGADIAVTSILMDAAKQAFPEAAIYFVGNEKNAALWEQDARVTPAVIPYKRTATLADRLEAARPLRVLVDVPDAVVIDPDSRQTQLGLIPVCTTDRYFFFESRAWGGDSVASLPELARAWANETLGVPNARAYVAPAPEPVGAGAYVTVSFGVGENPAKRVGVEFEAGVLSHLVSRGLKVVVDEGLGEEERERVRAAAAVAGHGGGVVETISGPFAPFAARIARSGLYVGYDSSGQHVAAACGIPLVVAFAGEPCERFYHRWRPDGSGPCDVIRATGKSEADVLRLTCAAIDKRIG